MADSVRETTIMAVLGRTFLSWRRHLQRQVQKAGCSIQQYHVLKQLVRHEILRPSDIATLLFCDRPTATVVVRNLAAAGLAAVSPDPSDGRQRLVTITDAGRAVLRAAETFATSARAALHPLDPLSDEERAQLLRILRKVEKHVAEAAAEAAGESGPEPTKE